MFAKTQIRSAVGSFRQFSSVSAKLQEPLSFKSVFGRINQAEAAKEAEPAVYIEQSFIPKVHVQDTYDPFDFSFARTKQHYKREQNAINASSHKLHFNDKNLNPLDFYCFPAVLSQYLNQSGQILHRDVTGLSPSKQRKMSLAIRRARAFGLLSSTAKDVSYAPKRGPTLR